MEIIFKRINMKSTPVLTKYAFHHAVEAKSNAFVILLRLKAYYYFMNTKRLVTHATVEALPISRVNISLIECGNKRDNVLL